MQSRRIVTNPRVVRRQLAAMRQGAIPIARSLSLHANGQIYPCIELAPSGRQWLNDLARVVQVEAPGFFAPRWKSLSPVIGNAGAVILTIALEPATVPPCTVIFDLPRHTELLKAVHTSGWLALRLPESAGGAALIDTTIDNGVLAGLVQLLATQKAGGGRRAGAR